MIEGFGRMRLRFVRLEPDELVIQASCSGEAGMPPGQIHRAPASSVRPFFAEFENEFRLA